MVDYLVEAESLNLQMGHDGIVVTPGIENIFCSTRTTSPLRIMRSTDLGLTWSLHASIAVQANQNECAMFIDSSNNLHVAHRHLGGQGIQYKRYDAPGYSLSVDEDAVPDASVDSNSPFGILAPGAGSFAGRTYVFYLGNLGGNNYQWKYAERTAPATWNFDNILLTGGAGNRGFNFDVFLASDDASMYIVRQGYVFGSSVTAFTAITLFTFTPPTRTVVWSDTDATNRKKFIIQEVNNNVRVYWSSAPGISGSNTIVMRGVNDSGSTDVFTSSNSSHNLLGVSLDPDGAIIFYGQEGAVPLNSRKHNNDGSLGNETSEVTTAQNFLFDVNYLQIAYPRKITGFTGGSGVFSQPLGSTRFFSSLVPIVETTGDNQETFLLGMGDFVDLDLIASTPYIGDDILKILGKRKNR